MLKKLLLFLITWVMTASLGLAQQIPAGSSSTGAAADFLKTLTGASGSILVIPPGLSLPPNLILPPLPDIPKDGFGGVSIGGGLIYVPKTCSVFVKKNIKAEYADVAAQNEELVEIIGSSLRNVLTVAVQLDERVYLNPTETEILSMLENGLGHWNENFFTEALFECGYSKQQLVSLDKSHTLYFKEALDFIALTLKTN